MENKFVFKPRARLLLQLGDQLIKNGTIALTELIKNSYDADASYVSINMLNIEEDDKKIGLFDEPEIIIKDNGCGMDLNIIENVWLELGSDFKKKKFENEEHTPKYKRLPLGEKGIGRLGVHKLGDEIELISKMDNKKEIVIKIDWKKFETANYLNDVPITVFEREPKVFKGETGTQITIKKLRTVWNKKNVTEVYHSINSLSSPFNKINNFSFDFNINNKNWLDNMIKFDTIIKRSLFYFKGAIEGDEITDFYYEFKPWDDFSHRIDSKIIQLKDLVTSKMVYEHGKKTINLSKHKIGKITIEGYIFDRDTALMNFIETDKKGFKEYLNTNGGFKVYRDNMRIYDYGEPGNDWLGKDLNRVNMPAKRVSNNIVLSMVNLDRNNSQDLKEKTNREGFIENEAFFAFSEAVLYFITKVEQYRYIDKGNLKAILNTGSIERNSISNNIEQLKEIVNDVNITPKDKDKMDNYINQIETEYKIIEKEFKATEATLLESSSSGINLSIYVHEIEKSFRTLELAVQSKKDFSEIEKIVKSLSGSLALYGSLLKKGNSKNIALKSTLKNILDMNELRTLRHNITLEIDYNELEGKKIIFPQKQLRNIIINILDNSVAWLKYSRNENKKIKLFITNEIKGYLTVIILDNGPGFTISEKEAKTIFVTTRPFNEGAGLGLYIVNEILNKNNGKLIIDDIRSLVTIPENFSTGAAVGLAFKKEEEEE